MFITRRWYAYVLLVVFLFSAVAFGNPIYDFHIFNSLEYENDPCLSFTVTISDEGFNLAGNAQAGFKFDNLSTANSSVTHIYFDDGSLLDLDVFEISGEGVSFEQDTKGKNLPGGENLTPSFDKKADFSAGSTPSVSHNGIHPGEWLKIVYSLKPGRDYNDVIYEIANGGNELVDNLRIGLHIQSLGPCDNSVSVINYTNPVPEPATVVLFGLGLTLLRKRKIA